MTRLVEGAVLLRTRRLWAPPPRRESPGRTGGAEGTRTPDPHTASVVRYQLRHSPELLRAPAHAVARTKLHHRSQQQQITWCDRYRNLHDRSHRRPRSVDRRKPFRVTERIDNLTVHEDPRRSPGTRRRQCVPSGVRIRYCCIALRTAGDALRCQLARSR